MNIPEPTIDSYRTDIVLLLQARFAEPAGRRGYFENAFGLNHIIVSDFDYTGAERPFAEKTYRTLLNYGCLPDGRHALGKLLEVVAEDLGEGKQKIIKGWIHILDNLCKEVQATLYCPYPDMKAFQSNDIKPFFGRSKEIEALIHFLKRNQIIAVLGKSGTGKSSLVLKGIEPHLQGHTEFGGNSSSWVVRTIRPGSTPMQALQTSIGLETVTIDQAVENVLKNNNATYFLCIIDQAEELFAPEEVPAPKEAYMSEVQERETFQQMILTICQHANCRVILTVRSDFYEKLMDSQLGKKGRPLVWDLPPLTNQGLTDAIVLPAQQALVSIDPKLVQQLLNDADIETYPERLPFVQATLVDLWGRLDKGNRSIGMEAYEALRQIGKKYQQKITRTLSPLEIAIITRAESAWHEIQDSDNEILARSLFFWLIQLQKRDGQTRYTRRQRSLEQLQSLTGEQLQSSKGKVTPLKQVIEAFASPTVRILTIGGNEHDIEKGLVGEKGSAEHVFVDIVHEELIVGWPRLQDWLVKWQDAMLLIDRYLNYVVEWRQNGTLLTGKVLNEVSDWLASTVAKEILGVTSQNALAELVEQSRNRQRQFWVAIASIVLGVAVVVWGFLLLYANYVSPFLLQFEAKNALERELIPEGDNYFTRLSSSGAITQLCKRHSEYTIDRTEVTNEQFCRCYNAEQCQEPANTCDLPPQLPVVNVNAYTAQQFCQWVGGRLPTELEWERAANGATCARDYITQERPVAGAVNVEGTELWSVTDIRDDRTAEGIFGLGGNASEWTLSPHLSYDPHSNYWEITETADLPPPEVAQWVVRGASFRGEVRRNWERMAAEPSNTTESYIGFRCVYPSEAFESLKDCQSQSCNQP